jgi:hypothetical protein
MPVNLEIIIDGKPLLKAEIDFSLFRNLLHGTPVPFEMPKSTPASTPMSPAAVPFEVPKSTPMSPAEITDLLSRIDPKSVTFLKQIGANNGTITWAATRVILGIEDPENWKAYSGGLGKGITRAMRKILGDESARLVWWDDNDPRWESSPEDKDQALLYVDGPALKSLQQVKGVAAEWSET